MGEANFYYFTCLKGDGRFYIFSIRIIYISSSRMYSFTYPVKLELPASRFKRSSKKYMKISDASPDTPEIKRTSAEMPTGPSTLPPSYDSLNLMSSGDAAPRPIPYTSPRMSVRRAHIPASFAQDDFQPALPSPITNLWNDQWPSESKKVASNVNSRDASVNTDCSLFYEGAPLYKSRPQQHQRPLQQQQHQLQHHQQPLQQQQQPIFSRIGLPSRPSSFIDNLNTIAVRSGVVVVGNNNEGIDISPSSSPSSSLNDSSSSSASETNSPNGRGKGAEQTPRPPATGKRAKFLCALAKVGIKTSTRAWKDFSPLVMENSDS